jgi:Ca2+/H+ antiporter
MKCISFGFLIVYIILVALVSSVLAAFVPQLSDPIHAIGGLVNLGLIVWFIVGFMTKCDVQQ